MHAVITVHRQGDLLEVARALRPPRRLAGRLHRRQEQGQEHADHRDDDQELEQGEAGRSASHAGDPPVDGRVGSTRAIGRTAGRGQPPAAWRSNRKRFEPPVGHVHAQLGLRIVDLGETFDHRPPGAVGLAVGRRRLHAGARVDPDPVSGGRRAPVARDGERPAPDRRADGRARLVGLRRFQEDGPVVERLPVEGDGPRDRLSVPRGRPGRSLGTGPRRASGPSRGSWPNDGGRRAATGDSWSMLMSRVDARVQ